MDLRPISGKQKSRYNKSVAHVMQSWEWGEFREKMGLKVLRYGIYKQGKLKTAFQLTIHLIPFSNKTVGYLPKGVFPDKEFAEALKKIGKKYNCAFIKIEPNVILRESSTEGSSQLREAEDSSPASPVRNDKAIDSSFRRSFKPMFSKFNFLLDLTKTEEELLKQLSSKTRYNIRVAQKHGVKVEERSDEEALEIYLRLYFETTKRQGFAGHNRHYHKTVWEALRKKDMARLLIAEYNGEPLTAWMLFNFKDTLFYTYGGSTQTHKEVMSNNLVCWETIKLGKKLGLKQFDMWGALGPSADPKDPWFGFHKFKQGYGGKLVEYIGTYDLIFNWPVYLLFAIIDRLTPVKIFLLKLLRK